MHHKAKHTWLVISIVLWKLKNLSKSQAATYTVSVEIPQKGCKVKTLLETTNRR